MNFVFISPNFPVRYFKWVEALKGHGVNVLGIGDEWYGQLDPRLKNALTEYYFVTDMSNYGDMAAAVRYFRDKYGPIDFIESNNEWWLEQDARLRAEFGVRSGFYPEEMAAIKAKSAMKARFEAAGVKTMRYLLIEKKEDLDKALEFANKVGYPVFVKPDIGVGANASYKLKDEAALRAFLANDLPERYIMEEYIHASIISFDGMCNDQSEVVFPTCEFFPMDDAPIVNEDDDLVYVSVPFELPIPEIENQAFLDMGRRVIKAFGIKQRFFHIEFFRLLEDKPGFAKKGEVVALECNMRPAGGYTPDLINYANSVSCYEIYADAICYNQNRQNMGQEKYYCFASARKDRFNYVHSHDEILNLYHDAIVMQGRYPHHIALEMGDSFYFARFKTYEEGEIFDKFVREKDSEHPENAPKRDPKSF